MTAGKESPGFSRGEDVNDDQLADAAGIASTGGTFTTYRGELVRNSLAERGNGSITATAILMRGSEAGNSSSIRG